MDPVDVEMLSSESGYAGDVSDDSSVTELVEIPKYKCKYCPKSYSKIQALGGHQNAHKKEREIRERQKLRMLASVYKPDPDPYPCPLPIQYALPPGFEEPHYIFDGPDNLPVVYNQCIRSSSSDFASLKTGSSKGMGLNWAMTGNPHQSVMAQPQPFVSPASPPICLDLCLGVGSSSQAQTPSKEPYKEIAAEKEDHDLSLSL